MSALFHYLQAAHLTHNHTHTNATFNAFCFEKMAVEKNYHKFFRKIVIRRNRQKTRKKGISKGESQRETWRVRESGYVGKILNLHKPFFSMFTLLLGVPSCHSNKNSQSTSKWTEGGLWSGQLLFSSTFFPQKPTVHGHNFLNINSRFYLDMQVNTLSSVPSYNQGALEQDSWGALPAPLKLLGS